MKKRTAKRADHVLFITVMVTVALGFVVFLSASLGLYARDGAEFTRVALTQAGGIVIGFLALVATSNIPYTFWRKYALVLFILATAGMALVLLPDIGFLHGGSRRWIILGPISIQPGELFKVAAVIFYAALLAKHRARIKQWKTSIIPLAVLSALSATLFLLQPKVGTLIILLVTLGVMLVASGARLRHISAFVLAALPIIALIALSLPYARERLEVFWDPGAEPLGSGYQIEQSLIAIGSGEWFGRGYGQSIQKFTFLPEPIGDSIFPVAAEEFGFLGASLIILLFLLIIYRGFLIAIRAPDYFSRLLVLGLVILIAVQSFVNIAAMLGSLPLTGMPLVFISHGGTAMVTALASIGIILNVSKYRRS